jgi:hypothetical protein
MKELKMKKSIIFISFVITTYGINSYSQADYSTQKIKKNKNNECEIIDPNNSTKTYEWCGSPCHKMYGNLKGKTC